jgi:Concanavalin A-like lectin/glucanases superfamily
MTAQKPIIHARDHLPGGADPIVAGPEPPTGYADTIVGISDLVGYWRMGEPSGDQLDYSQNPAGDKPLTRTGDTAGSYDVEGSPVDPAEGAFQQNVNMAAVSSSHGDWWAATDSVGERFAFAGADPFTVSLWLRWTSGWSIPSSAAPVMLAGTMAATGGGTIPGWGLLIDPDTGGMFLTGHRGSTAADSNVTDPDPAPADQWTHAALNYDGATLRLYRDGALVASVASTHAVTAEAMIKVGGGTNIWNSVANTLYGALDEVAVFSRALSDDEMVSLAAIPPASEDDLVLGIGDDGGLGWVQPKVDVTVNGEPPAGPATEPPPANPVVTPPPSTGTDGDDWIWDQPLVWGGASFDVEPNQWTTIPFTDVVMVRYSNQTSRGGTCDIEIDPADPSAAGWVDPGDPHAILVPHEFPIFADGFSWIQVCLFLETPEVAGPTSYRQLRVFETTRQKSVLRSGQFRYTCCIEHGAISVFRDPLAAGWTPPADGTDTFAEGDVGGFDNGGHNRVMLAPNSGYGWRLEGDTWLPKDTLGRPMLQAGMRLVAQVWHDAASVLTFDAGGTVASFGTPAHAPYRPHFCVFQSAPRSWGSPWSGWPTYP